MNQRVIYSAWTLQYSEHALLSLIMSDDIYWHLETCLILLNVFLSAGFCWFMEMISRASLPLCLGRKIHRKQKDLRWALKPTSRTSSNKGWNKSWKEAEFVDKDPQLCLEEDTLQRLSTSWNQTKMPRQHKLKSLFIISFLLWVIGSKATQQFADGGIFCIPYIRDFSNCDDRCGLWQWIVFVKNCHSNVIKSHQHSSDGDKLHFRGLNLNK